MSYHDDKIEDMLYDLPQFEMDKEFALVLDKRLANSFGQYLWQHWWWHGLLFRPSFQFSAIALVFTIMTSMYAYFSPAVTYGEPLYLVKQTFEYVDSSLAITPTQKIRVNLKHNKRRLQEVAYLSGLDTTVASLGQLVPAANASVVNGITVDHQFELPLMHTIAGITANRFETMQALSALNDQSKQTQIIDVLNQNYNLDHNSLLAVVDNLGAMAIDDIKISLAESLQNLDATINVLQTNDWQAQTNQLGEKDYWLTQIKSRSDIARVITDLQSQTAALNLYIMMHDQSHQANVAMLAQIHKHLRNAQNHFDQGQLDASLSAIENARDLLYYANSLLK